MRNQRHWLLRPTYDPRHGVGSYDGGDRCLDMQYIQTLFEDAPDEALAAAYSIIALIQRERLIGRIEEHEVLPHRHHHAQ